jgi:hypothetical protein
MAQAPREFAVDFNRGKVFANATTETAYTFKKFKNGDTERFRVYVVKANLTSPGKLTLIAATGMILKIAIGNLGSPTSTTYTSVTCSVSSDGNYFEGDLPLNVAAVNNLFASTSTDVPALLEFELNDGGYYQSHDVDVSIRHQVITTTLTDTLPPDRSLGAQEAEGLYVPQVWPDGFQFITKDNDGSGRRYLVYVYGGALKFEPIGS